MHDRREFLHAIGHFGAAGLAVTAGFDGGGWPFLAAQVPSVQPPNIAPPAIQKLRENFYLIGGSDAEQRDTWTGGCSAVFITQKHGVVVVDGKNRGWGKHMEDQIRKVTDKPITTLIITHLHGDHVASIPEMSPTFESVAHVNCASALAKSTCPGAGCQYFQGDNAKYLPKQTYKDRLTLFDGSDRIELYYFGPAHTDGDAIVHFPSLNIVHVGDLYPGKYSPFLDTVNGGSGLGNIRVLSDLGKIKKIDTVIAGHRDAPQKAADMMEYRDWLKHLSEVARAGVKAGQTPDQITAAYTLPARYRTYGLNTKGAPTRLRTNFGVFCDELKKTT